MQTRRISRATPPDLTALSDALRPILAAANAGSFHARYENGAVIIEQASFAGVTLSAIEAAVAAAPAATVQTQAKTNVDQWPIELRALFLCLVDEINRLRTQPTTAFPAITAAQAWNAVKNKAETLS